MHFYILIVITNLYTLALILIFLTLEHTSVSYGITNRQILKKSGRRLFSNKDIDTRVSILNETILNIFSNYVPNKYITIDDKDPVWMNETIKLKIKAKDNMYKKYIQNGRFESDFVLLETLITELNELVSTTKALYYENTGKKLNNPLL